MNIKELMKYNFKTSEGQIRMYLEGLSDEDILLQAVDGMNTIAWQLGHLISAESHLLNAIKPDSSPELSEEFLEVHSQENAQKVDKSKYSSIDEYLGLLESQRSATLKVLAEIDEAIFDEEAPEFIQKLAKTKGEMMMLIGSHYTLHSGQFVAVRRKLEKPIAL